MLSYFAELVFKIDEMNTILGTNSIIEWRK